MQVASPNLLVALVQSGTPATQLPAALQAALQQAALQQAALQPGQIVNALVLQVLADGTAQIALADQVLQVKSDVPLVTGTTMQLAVRSAPSGLTLSPVVGAAPPGRAAEPPVAARLRAPAAGDAPSPALVTSAAPPADRTDARPPATPAQVALGQAVRSAAGRQNGLALLFADVAVAADVDALPPPVRQAAAALLAVPLKTDAPVTAVVLKQAFSQSGLLMEAKMALAPSSAVDSMAARTPAAQAASGVSRPTALADAPDLKAALIVFRQVLRAWLATEPPRVQAVPAAAAGSAEAPPPSRFADPAAKAQGGETAANAPAPHPAENARSLPVAGAARDPDPLAGTPVVGRPSPASGKVANSSSVPDIDLASTPKRGLASAAPEMVAVPEEPQHAIRPAAGPPVAVADGPVVDAPEPRTQVPPPYRGAPPSPQGAAPPSVAADDPPRAIGERLLADTDAALARQTLLQAASLPDDRGPQRPEGTQSQWAFEIPLATPQGTAVAQFEIARDGRGTHGDPARAAWRARFSLDVEPMGPVHVQITLSGARTGVTLWAERAASAARLREDAPLLAMSLTDADLAPGDVLVRTGEPPRREPAAGQFVDHAT